MKYKRIFLLITDSLGVGYDSKSHLYGDEGANTLKHIDEGVDGLNIPTLASLGMGDFVNLKKHPPINHPNSFTVTLNEMSIGKDTLTGHWEMMGVYTTSPFKTFTDTGFPEQLIKRLEKETGHKIIGNVAASGTEIIKELGEEQMRDNSLIVYTSSDSVLQIAAHEEVTGLKELYRVCEIARKICMEDDYKVGRIIARPFIGTSKENFKRTSNRHDYALKPPVDTVLNILIDNGYKVHAIGKINDIFASKGISTSLKTTSNTDGMNKTIDYIKNSYDEGLYFLNLVEFDSEYGHRRDVRGYANAIETFDKELKVLMNELHEDDLLMISADHGNDPTWKGTDHTREKVPLIIYSKNIRDGKYLKERNSFSDIGITILNNYHLKKNNSIIGHGITEVL